MNKKNLFSIGEVAKAAGITRKAILNYETKGLIMSDKKVSLVAAADVRVVAEKFNLDNDRITYLKEGEVFRNGSISIKAMPCDHGEETPDAIGLLITIDEKYE